MKTIFEIVGIALYLIAFPLIFAALIVLAVLSLALAILALPFLLVALAVTRAREKVDAFREVVGL